MNHVDIPPSKRSVTKTSSIIWGPVLLAFLSLVTLGWLDNARGPLYPQIIEGLSLTHVQGGLFFALASLVSVLANFLVPHLLRIMSSVNVLLLGLSFMVSFVFLFSVVGHYSTLLLAAILFGMAMGTVMVTINIVIEEFVPPQQQRSFLSFMHSLYGLSAFLSPVLIGVILSWPIKWSHAFLPVLFVSLPLMGFGALQSLKIRHRKISPASVNTATPQDSVQLEKAAGVVEVVKTKLNIPERRSLIVFWSVLLALYVSSELYFSTRITILFQEGLGYDLSAARKFLSFFFLGLFLGRVLNSVLPVRIQGRQIIFASLLCSFLWSCLCLMFFPAWIWWIGFLMAPVYPVAVSEIAQQSKGEFKKISAICIATSSFFVVIMHMLAGATADILGLQSSMYIPVVFLFLALVLVFKTWPKTS